MMSIIALESNTGADRIQRSAGFIHGMSSYNGIYDPAGGGGSGDRRFRAMAAAAAAAVKDDGGDSCSSSSIGRNSEDLPDGDSSDGEVQSSVRGGALNNLNDLEEALPIKRGISTHYAGKSKSFTNLTYAETCSSINEIAKPEDANTRKRKNLLAHSIISDKNHNSLSSSSSSGGLSKRLASSSRSTMAFGLTMASSVSSNNNECSLSKSSSPCIALPPLPPLPPHGGRRLPNNETSSSPTWRSFSITDLQHTTTPAPSPPANDSVMNNKEKKL